MNKNALSYVSDAIFRELAGKEFEDVRDKKHYKFLGIKQGSPVKFEFRDTHCQIVCSSYSFFELENLREIEQSPLEQATQSMEEGEK